MIFDQLINFKASVSTQISGLTIGIVGCLIFLTWLNASFAQNLTLFEETDADKNAVVEDGTRGIRRGVDGNIITGPEFTLIGTTRIGGSFLVVVEDRVGKVISVSVPEESNAPIPGYPNFEVVDIGSGNVTVNYPKNLPCAEFKNQGVICEDSNTARLMLANAEPLERLSSSMVVRDGNNSQENFKISRCSCLLCREPSLD